MLLYLQYQDITHKKRTDIPVKKGAQWCSVTNSFVEYLLEQEPFVEKTFDHTFCPDELISRQDFALMAHRYADKLGFGTAMDYGRTDWFDDYFDIDFYAWVPFTWAIQWRVLSYDKENNLCYPHGRMTKAELKAGVAEIFDLDEGAAYSGKVGGNVGNPNE